MSELKSRLQADMKLAMKAGEKERLGVIRLMLAAIKQREVDERIELNDVDVVAVLDRMVKQRRESIAQYEAAARTDLAAIAETGAAGLCGMSKVMAVLRAPMQGRADMARVSHRVKSRLTG